jgi:phosphatidylglycerophosphate synthase
MQLHIAGKKADWASIPAAERNHYQRLAAASHSIVTPGNLVTITGFALVLIGCWQLSYDRLWLGLSLILVGRGCDIIDGWLAELTGTKSPLGRTLDALIDKLGSLAALIALYAAQLVPNWLLISIFGLQFITSLLSIAYQFSGNPRQPTREGKVGAAIYWIVVLGYILLAALDVHSGALRFSLAAAGVFSLLLGVIALRDYIRPHGG